MRMCRAETCACRKNRVREQKPADTFHMTSGSKNAHVPLTAAPGAWHTVLQPRAASVCTGCPCTRNRELSAGATRRTYDGRCCRRVVLNDYLWHLVHELQVRAPQDYWPSCTQVRLCLHVATVSCCVHYYVCTRARWYRCAHSRIKGGRDCE